MDIMMIMPMRLCWPFGLCGRAQVGKASQNIPEENTNTKETQQIESGER